MNLSDIIENLPKPIEQIKKNKQKIINQSI